MKTQKSNGPRLWIVATAALSAFAASACNEDPESTPKAATYSASLASFDSCDDLDTYLTDLATTSLVDAYAYGYGYGYGFGVPIRGGVEDTATDGGVAAPSESGGGSPTDFTGTNNQEVGVDEPDLVKTDGDYMYVVNGSQLTVVDSWPAEEAHEVATLPLTGWGQQMFLEGDRLVLLTQISTGSYPSGGGSSEPGVPTPAPDEGRPDDAGGDVVEPTPDPLDDGAWFSGTRVTIVDVSDPTSPTVAEMFDVEGYVANARLVDGKVFLVLNSDILGSAGAGLYEALSGVEYPSLDWDATTEERDAAAAEFRAAIEPIIADYVAREGRAAVIPDVRDADGRADLFACGQMMHPAVQSGAGVLAVVGFDPEAPVPAGVGLLASGYQVYGSQTSLYVAQDSRWWSWARPTDAVAKTHIHKFDLGGGIPTYSASGEVEGWLLNQFSMSEYDGVLRVATTDAADFGWGVAIDVAVPGDTVDVEADAGSATTDGGAAPAPDAGSSDGGGSDKTVTDLRTDETVQANNVFTLRQSGRVLDVIGGIRGIAPTEQIYAVRFLGDRGYIVTFRQTDPLFALDLSDPTTPVLTGELHIPGYSGYLHPFGDHHLIGLGRDGDETGRVGGLQVSVFDVSDPAAPTRTAQLALSAGDGSYSWSEAEYDHHAFTFYESRGLLAIPVNIEDWSATSDAYSHFSGVVVFHVTEDSVDEAGRVSHSPMAIDRYCGDTRVGDPEVDMACAEWSYPWWVQMRRSVFIEDFLYAISDFGLTVSATDALDEVLAEVRY